MGWSVSESDGKCRKHPNHGQSEGVCSFCVAERLAKLSKNGSSSSSSRTNSPPCSSVVSPPVMGSVSFMVSVSNGLKKSRSVACAHTRRVGQVNKRRGFWSKLLRSGSKEEAVNFH